MSKRPIAADYMSKLPDKRQRKDSHQKSAAAHEDVCETDQQVSASVGQRFDPYAKRRDSQAAEPVDRRLQIDTQMQTNGTPKSPSTVSRTLPANGGSHSPMVPSRSGSSTPVNNAPVARMLPPSAPSKPRSPTVSKGSEELVSLFGNLISTVKANASAAVRKEMVQQQLRAKQHEIEKGSDVLTGYQPLAQQKIKALSRIKHIHQDLLQEGQRHDEEEQLLIGVIVERLSTAHGAQSPAPPIPASLSTDVQALKDQLQRQATEIEDLKMKQRLAAEHKTMADTIGAKQTKVDSKLEEISKTLRSLQDTLKYNNNQIKMLEREDGTLHGRINARKDDMNDLEDNMRKARQGDYDTLDARCIKLGERCTTAEKSTDKLRDRFTAVEKGLDRVQASEGLRSANKIMIELGNFKREYQKDQTAMKTELEGLRASHLKNINWKKDNFVPTSTVSEDKFAGLQARVEKLEPLCDTLDAATNKASESITLLQSDFATFQTDIYTKSEARDRNSAALEKRVSDLDSRTDQLKCSVNASKATVTGMKQTVAGLEEHMTELGGVISDLKNVRPTLDALQDLRLGERLTKVENNVDMQIQGYSSAQTDNAHMSAKDTDELFERVEVLEKFSRAVAESIEAVKKASTEEKDLLVEEILSETGPLKELQERHGETISALEKAIWGTTAPDDPARSSASGQTHLLRADLDDVKRSPVLSYLVDEARGRFETIQKLEKDSAVLQKLQKNVEELKTQIATASAPAGLTDPDRLPQFYKRVSELSDDFSNSSQQITQQMGVVNQRLLGLEQRSPAQVVQRVDATMMAVTDLRSRFDNLTTDTMTKQIAHSLTEVIGLQQREQQDIRKRLDNLQQAVNNAGPNQNQDYLTSAVVKLTRDVNAHEDQLATFASENAEEHKKLNGRHSTTSDALRYRVEKLEQTTGVLQPRVIGLEQNDKLKHMSIGKLQGYHDSMEGRLIDIELKLQEVNTTITTTAPARTE